MDVKGLQSELEHHLGKNPDEDAPNGFRDRFNEVAERHAAGGGDVPLSVHEAELQQIRDEAEAAANAARHDTTTDPETPPPDRAADERGPGDPAIDTGAAPSGDTLRRFGMPLVLILILIVAALLFLR